MEEVSWRKKSRALWFEEGHKNSKFFHHMANARKRVNLLANLKVNVSLIIWRRLGRRLSDSLKIIHRNRLSKTVFGWSPYSLWFLMILRNGWRDSGGGGS